MYNKGSSYKFGYDQVEAELELEASNMAGSSSSSGSPTMGAFERSIAALSLRKAAATSSSLLVLPEDSHDAPFRRVYSAGDLHSVNSYMARRRSEQRAESPLSISNENSLIIQGIMKATKYTPQEKKERIERYRNKRNLRNFHKKIQYTCRKTLADSRPRIKGRFVRNDEVSTSIASTNMETTAAEDGNYTTYDEGHHYCVLNDQFSSSHHQQQQQLHMMNNVGEEFEEEGEENSWINLFDCSFPFPTSQFQH